MCKWPWTVPTRVVQRSTLFIMETFCCEHFPVGNPLLFWWMVYFQVFFKVYYLVSWTRNVLAKKLPFAAPFPLIHALTSPWFRAQGGWIIRITSTCFLVFSSVSLIFQGISRRPESGRTVRWQYSFPALLWPGHCGLAVSLHQRPTPTGGGSSPHNCPSQVPVTASFTCPFRPSSVCCSLLLQPRGTRFLQACPCLAK